MMAKVMSALIGAIHKTQINLYVDIFVYNRIVTRSMAIAEFSIVLPSNETLTVKKIMNEPYDCHKETKDLLLKAKELYPLAVLDISKRLIYVYSDHESKNVIKMLPCVQDHDPDAIAYHMFP